MRAAGLLAFIRHRTLTLVLSAASVATLPISCGTGSGSGNGGSGGGGSGHSVTVSWTASPAQFNVYRSSTSGGPYSFIGSTPSLSIVDTDVSAGAEYCYVVTAVRDGVESAYSEESCARIPSP